MSPVPHEAATFKHMKEPYLPQPSRYKSNTRPKWAGGTWDGCCGSMLWIPASDNIIIIQKRAINVAVSTSQAWFRNQARGQHEHGYWVECQMPHEHTGPCTIKFTNGQIHWIPEAYIP